MGFEEGMWTHWVEVEQSVKSMKKSSKPKRKQPEPSKPKKEPASKNQKVAPDASVAQPTQRNLRPRKKEIVIQDPVVELSESDEEPKQQLMKTRTSTHSKNKLEMQDQIEEDITGTKTKSKDTSPMKPKTVKELSVKSEDKVQVRLSLKGDLKEILFSAGQHVLLCMERIFYLCSK